MSELTPQTSDTAPLLSIVVPCYNVGAAMLPLLQRVTAQMADDCELVLIDDGSRDGTADTVRAFQVGYTGPGQIALTVTPNAGAAKARELGLSLARGRFVYFCDSDDIMQPTFVQVFRRTLAQYPALDLLFFSSEISVVEPGGMRRLGRKLEYDRVQVFDHGADLLEYNLRQHMHTAAVWTFVARRDLLQAAGASFTRRGAHEDHLFTLSTMLHARCVVALPELLYTQTLRAGSLTNSAKDARYINERISAFNEADALLRTSAPRLRALYDAESFDAIAGMVADNRHLLPAVVAGPVGLGYFAARAPRVAARLGRRVLGAVRRRLAPGASPSKS
ncbi:hypothetical protein ASF61_18275 [Duganella sp. Leaf126]|uniref:glycosyltransferase family 2 protein n=1 Tax=Duganella sp. Leaf126 TaxID=1736266 RepID=UPI0006F80026|nr:glycosyltransferase [Duganella sp. Leaf126]KQQ46348.1 hypothetical protein ASF61_18275 [Duganella sp. Leaf126]